MIKKLILFVFLVCSSVDIYSQSLTNSNLIAYARATPEKYTKDTYSLATYLQAGAQNKKETVELFFYWIAHHIAYDVEMYQSRNFSDVTVVSALEKRKIICQGYAELFATLCEDVDINCEVIRGYGKGFSYTGKKERDTNHAWNAVKIDNQWYLLDVTWGSGHAVMEENQMKYVQELNLRYLFTKPEKFVLNHLPQDAKWQLLSKLVSEEQFYSTDFEVERLNSYAEDEH
ncbi:transglutaminase domain-containing protein [Rhodocytophaga aerolata]|uniref:Transglutaminase domain-containing protein n=1 Tax=Rhodocytophaga aerolata TaxID=455078 RepID=A0ABT8RHJ4_9BACT|nr:transglutaminase domain-containing protein [Rhodocytophaga aerolata]MDO1451565.1 transglutaminase domain-containing protein [Rhodocytophaga aerolata]